MVAAPPSPRNESPEPTSPRSAGTATEQHPGTHDLRVEALRPLVPPALLCEEIPLTDAAAASVSRARAEILDVLHGRDDRLIVVVGPCSVHDCEAALDYAQRLRSLADEVADDLLVVMRVYFEKPRTTIGWKGLVYDPHLDGSHAANHGLRLGRRLLVDVAEMGLPTACEFLDPISPQFFADIVAWAAIGARTTESQVHRQLASGLSMPVGFKNGTDGSVETAVAAVKTAAHPHSFFGVTEQGLAAIVQTRGNADCHVILRGSIHGPNYDAASVATVLGELRKSGLPAQLMIDASHGNSGKDFHRQVDVLQDTMSQLAQGERGIIGVMVESFLVEGRQDLVDPSCLVYGQSITDACISWDSTETVLRDLAGAVRARRAVTTA